MPHSSRLVLAAALALPGVPGAQQPLDPILAAAMRAAERYVDCMMREDLDCLEELTHRERLQAAAVLSTELARLRRGVDPLDHGVVGADHMIEIAEPWPAFSVDNVRYTFVPYFETYANEQSGQKLETMAYLIGASDDDGVSWRFIQVNIDSALRTNEIDRVIRGYGVGPRPPVYELEFREDPLLRSRWLDTKKSRFVFVDEAFAYSLELEIRKDVESPIDLTIHYDDPAHPDRPLRFRGTLQPGQRDLLWQSPVLSAFETGQIYDVLIEGSDPHTGKAIFEHRESLLFYPSRAFWLAVLSKPPAERTESTPEAALPLR